MLFENIFRIGEIISQIPPSIKLSTANQGSLLQVRQRTVGDELAAGVAQAPTKRAIRMANALMLERILGTG